MMFDDMPLRVAAAISLFAHTSVLVASNLFCRNLHDEDVVFVPSQLMLCGIFSILLSTHGIRF